MSGRPFTEEERAEAEALRAEGKSYRQIGFLLHRRHSSVQWLLTPRLPGEKRGETWTEEEKKTAETMRRAGRSYREIGAVLNRSINAVAAQLDQERRRGLYSKPRPRILKRPCLRCGTTFTASGRFNRLCEFCREYAGRNNSAMDVCYS